MVSGNEDEMIASLEAVNPDPKTAAEFDAAVRAAMAASKEKRNE